MINPSKYWIIILAIFLGTLRFEWAHSQVINVELEIEPELRVSIQNTLNFPEVVTNSGDYSIGLGDPNMGVFSITTLNTQHIHVQINAPESLQLIGDNDNKIPINIFSYYNNSDTDDYKNSKLIQNNFGRFAINESANTSETELDWNTFYIYITAQIDVGDVALGTYSGNIELVVNFE